MSFPADNTWKPTFISSINWTQLANSSATLFSGTAPYDLRIIDMWVANGATATVNGDLVKVTHSATDVEVAAAGGVIAGGGVFRCGVNLAASNSTANVIKKGETYTITSVSAAGGYTGGTVFLLVEQL